MDPQKVFDQIKTWEPERFELERARFVAQVPQSEEKSAMLAMIDEQWLRVLTARAEAQGLHVKEPKESDPEANKSLRVLGQVAVPVTVIVAAGGGLYLAGLGISLALPVIVAVVAPVLKFVAVVACAGVGLFLLASALPRLGHGHGTWQPENGPTPGDPGPQQRETIVEQYQRTTIKH